MKRFSLALGIVALVACGIIVGAVLLSNSSTDNMTKVRFRLLWVPQSQFAGFIVAKEKGYYEEVGLDVQLLPAGPDLKPHVTVAAGTDDMGISVPNSIIGARSNNVPLVAVAQVFQDSPNRYILKKQNRISDLRELRGKKVGLWLGGDEAEFVSMLATAEMKLSDVQVIPQEFSVVPFLEDQYVLSQVTVYNELNLIRAQGYEGDELQVLSPRDYNSAILGDVVFTSEEFLAENPKAVQAFLEASLRGWQFCLDDPEAAVDIVLRANPELDRDEQRAQMKAVLSLLTSGPAKTHGLYYLDAADYETAERVLFESGQIEKHVAIETVIDLSPWKAVPDSLKRVD